MRDGGQGEGSIVQGGTTKDESLGRIVFLTHLL